MLLDEKKKKRRNTYCYVIGQLLGDLLEGGRGGGVTSSPF